ncbi:MAG: MFS transporter [Euryarchaeota archaeon]|nr:MFS transporter [Euryarchaeota archaeon]MDE1835598.1 MFS transporter [Euryarchaeota archaeon]MDE1878946.1 MFS transporter [Euryarchaeota archaeon]MDE2043780.1 MFS transporter [Thermoplasmata archaeon]
MGASPSSAPGVGLASVLRDRNFLRLFLAGATSISGGAIASVTISWIVFSSTRSAFAIALVGIVTTVTIVVMSLPSGVWVDRYDRRRVMVASDLARAGAIGALAFTFWRWGFSLPMFLVVAFVSGCVGTLFTPAEQSLIPSILPKHQLADANGLVRSSRSIISMLSNSIAGTFLLVAGVVLSLLYNTLTFLLSAALVFTVSVGTKRLPRKLEEASVPRRRMLSEIAEGGRWLLSSKGLFELSISALFMNFFSSIFLWFIVVYVTLGLHGTPLTFGLFLATMTGGTAAGGLLVGRTRAVKHAGKVWTLGYGVVCGVLLLALSRSGSFYLSVPIVFAFSLVMQVAGTTWLTTAQTIVPERMRGRYFSIDGILSYAVMPVAQVVGALLITYRGISFALEVAGGGLLLTGALSTVGRALWRLDGTAEPRPS